MPVGSDQIDNSALPDARQITEAIRIYLEAAYGNQIPHPILKFIPPAEFSPPKWLMSDFIEHDLEQVPPGSKVRSFALRMGNSIYPHMKLRITIPPNACKYLFQVDSHDQVLTAPSGSADIEALEELKHYNSSLVEQISASMDSAGLPTERGHLREGIARARRKKL